MGDCPPRRQRQAAGAGDIGTAKDEVRRVRPYIKFLNAGVRYQTLEHHPRLPGRQSPQLKQLRTRSFGP
jgi:hypothetical protein